VVDCEYVVWATAPPAMSPKAIAVANKDDFIFILLVFEVRTGAQMAPALLKC
jgi:hypothetical protein